MALARVRHRGSRYLRNVHHAAAHSRLCAELCCDFSEKRNAGGPLQLCGLCDSPEIGHENDNPSSRMTPSSVAPGLPVTLLRTSCDARAEDGARCVAKQGSSCGF